MGVETIVAIATPPGRGGIGIVRVSGPAAAAMAVKVLGFEPKPRHAHHARFRDAAGAVIDEGIALYFPGPKSFTGDDILELHGHGGPVVMDLLLARLLALGARLARPGEFSERAFLNGKLDLAQAEAIADLIDSASAQSARAAQRSLAGAFSASVNTVVDDVGDLRAYIEAALDFPDEEIDFLAEGDIEVRTERIGAALAALRASAREGALLRDGMKVAILGPPNAGKSSLLNRLAARDAAIVTAIPGTTRDPLHEQITVDGIPLHLVDTAGLRDAGDEIEQEGMRRTRAEAAAADHILWVSDVIAPVPPPADLPAGIPVTVVTNKIDLVDAAAGLVAGATPTVNLSARTGVGLDALVGHLKSVAGWQTGEGVFSARRRHLDALTRAADHVELGLAALRERRAGELLAEELRLAQAALGEITGAETTEDLLGRIFSAFCIGK